uniref:Uncharacterized protein n=1 Tax=Amphimedon queenslandica TaxID=400682 RepID=A0A1X7V6C5_AMPQE
LPQYDIPGSRKRKLTGIKNEPQAKNKKTIQPPNVVHYKRSRPNDDSCPKKLPAFNNSGNSNNNGNNNGQSADCFVDEAKSTPRPSTTIHFDPTKTWSNWVYNPVGIDWQRKTCQNLGLRFYGHNAVRHRGPNVQLRCPNISDMYSYKR